MRERDVTTLTSSGAAEGATRRELIGRASALAALLALPGGLLACGDSEPAGAGAGLSHLRWGVPSGVETISPNAFTAVGVTMAHMGLEALLQVNARGELEPWLADRFENRGNREFVLRLREGVRWSDGSPLTIDDVLFQFEYNLTEKAQPLFGFLDGFGLSVEQTGPREITVRAERPNPRIPAIILASQFTWLVQPAFLERAGYDRMGSPGALPIGTGPYVFEEFVPESSLTLRRNEHYWAWDRLALVPERITVSIFKESATRQLAARTGEIRGSHMVEPDELADYRSISGYSTYSVPDMSTWFFTMNTTAAPFDDVHCRRALAYAVDRDGIADAVWGGAALPAKTLVPPAAWGGLLADDELDRLHASLPTYQYDLDRAAAELRRSAHPDGFTVDVQTSDSRPKQSRICQILARDLAKIGITMNVRTVSENQYFEPLFANDPDDPSYILNIANTTNFESLDALPGLDDHLAARNTRPGGTNFSLFEDARVERLLRAQAETTDQGRRARLLSQIVRIAAEEVAYVPIVWPEIGAAVGPDLEYDGFNPFIFINGNTWPVGLRASA
jgi:peptide/nickel transport system substrate-binding protein